MTAQRRAISFDSAAATGPSDVVRKPSSHQCRSSRTVHAPRRGRSPTPTPSGARGSRPTHELKRPAAAVQRTTRVWGGELPQDARIRRIARQQQSRRAAWAKAAQVVVENERAETRRRRGEAAACKRVARDAVPLPQSSSGMPGSGQARTWRAADATSHTASAPPQGSAASPDSLIPSSQ